MHNVLGRLGGRVYNKRNDTLGTGDQKKTGMEWDFSFLCSLRAHGKIADPSAYFLALSGRVSHDPVNRCCCPGPRLLQPTMGWRWDRNQGIYNQPTATNWYVWMYNSVCPKERHPGFAVCSLIRYLSCVWERRGRGEEQLHCREITCVNVPLVAVARSGAIGLRPFRWLWRVWSVIELRTCNSQARLNVSHYIKDPFGRNAVLEVVVSHPAKECINHMRSAALDNDPRKCIGR